MKPVIKAAEAIVTKVTESGKSMYVGVRTSKYQIGYTFGWCRNPEGANKKGDKLTDFEYTGLVPMVKFNEQSQENEPMLHEDGSPVLAFEF